MFSIVNIAAEHWNKRHVYWNKRHVFQPCDLFWYTRNSEV